MNTVNNLVEIVGVSDAFPSNSRSFKHIQVQDIISVPNSKPFVDQLLRMVVNSKIMDHNFVQTLKAVSCEGQRLTGLKLTVDGHLEYKLEYLTESSDQTIYTINSFTPFSAYIILDESFSYDSEITVAPYVEDIYIRKIDGRKLQVSLMLLLDVSRVQY